MTNEEKTAAAAFLDIADDYLAGGYRKTRAPRVYTGGGERESPPGEGEIRAEFQGGASGASKAEPAASETEPAYDSLEPAAADEAVPADDSLEQVAADISRCGRCGLCSTRTNTVPGEGASRPLVMVVGEGPGADEDISGRPFVGRAGQLLDRMLDSKGKIGLSRSVNCYIANVVKCRPPQNRNPLPDETAACLPFLRRQIRLLKPLVILAAGNTAAKALLDTTEGITRLRGSFAAFSLDNRDIPLLPTFHPSALLRDEGLKVPVWNDMKTLRAKLCELDAGYAERMADTPL
ncbi:MAG: uracil-DNA glycosylase [Treponema sp.]|nr:uracil-DNA glycosylase [Treponema sp.]